MTKQYLIETGTGLTKSAVSKRADVLTTLNAQLNDETADVAAKSEAKSRSTARQALDIVTESWPRNPSHLDSGGGFNYVHLYIN